MYSKKVFKDVTSESISIRNDENKFEILIERNTPFPCGAKKVLKKLIDKEGDISIPVGLYNCTVIIKIFQIYEGLSEKWEENNYIGKIKITEIPLIKVKEIELEITLKVDLNGILQCETTIIIDKTPIKVISKIDFKIKYNFDIIEVKDE